MPFASIVKAQQCFYLVATKENDKWAVQGFHSLKEGRNYYERGYGEFHNRGYESSMSATLNWLTFQPSIVELTIKEMEDLTEKPLRVMSIRNCSGGFKGIPLLPEAATVWERGKIAELINEDMFSGEKHERTKANA